jgi:hypothetical protein
MGYTHYWNQARPFSPVEWGDYMAAARTIIRRARAQGIKVAGWHGTGRPQIDEDAVALNGREPEAFESFRVTSAWDSGRNFCKTGRRPYDAVVVALLIVGARMGVLSWSSDGGDEDHEAGVKLARDLP